MIAQLDENLGKLDDFLKSSGLRDNTIVIFMTDNGGTAGVKTFNAGMRAGKTTYYDGGHRVPCWIRWPKGKIGEPRDIDVPTQNTDIAPTLIHLTAIPIEETPKFDGTDLSGLLTRGEPLRDRMLVVQYGQQIEKHKACVIWNKWRLVHGTELYDIKADPAQATDLATKQPEVVARMKDHYEAWWKGVEPLINDYVETSLGSKAQPDVALTSSDWQDIYADNSNHIRSGAGGPRGGKWNVRVERAGCYEITLRRWPAEIDVVLSGSHGKLNNGEPAKAFPIASAVLSLSSHQQTERGESSSQSEQSRTTQPDARSVTFETNLKPGPMSLQAWFRDANGTDLCGAYFVGVKLLEASE
jgi:arylsulfatase